MTYAASMIVARLRPIVASVVAAALVPAAALAATTLRDAKSLALREADFPASVERMSQKETRAAPLPGGTGQAYTTTFQFRAVGAG